MMHITKNHNCDVPSRIKVPRGRIGVIQGIEKNINQINEEINQ